MAKCASSQRPIVIKKILEINQKLKSYIFRHNTFKIERIPGSKHRLRKATYRISKVPGKTHALNRKNSEMCNAIFR